MSKKRTLFLLFSSFVSIILSVNSAMAMTSRVRTVDILALFAGGFATGVTMISALVSYRLSRARAEMLEGPGVSDTPGGPVAD